MIHQCAYCQRYILEGLFDEFTGKYYCNVTHYKYDGNKGDDTTTIHTHRSIFKFVVLYIDRIVSGRVIYVVHPQVLYDYVSGERNDIPYFIRMVKPFREPFVDDVVQKLRRLFSRVELGHLFTMDYNKHFANGEHFKEEMEKYKSMYFTPASSSNLEHFNERIKQWRHAWIGGD